MNIYCTKHTPELPMCQLLSSLWALFPFCQNRRLDQTMSRGPATLPLPVFSFFTFQIGRRRFQQVSKVKKWIIELFKGCQQIFVKYSLLLPLLRESKARLMSQLPPQWDKKEQETQLLLQNIQCGWRDPMWHAAVEPQYQPALLCLPLCYSPLFFLSPVWSKGST